MLIAYGVFFSSLAAHYVMMFRDPWQIRTPIWAVLAVMIGLYAAGVFIISVFIVGAVLCHGTC